MNQTAELKRLINSSTTAATANEGDGVNGYSIGDKVEYYSIHAGVILARVIKANERTRELTLRVTSRKRGPVYPFGSTFPAYSGSAFLRNRETKETTADAK